MKFWTFSQNNSGGSFDFDEDNGITHHVIVQADDLSDAIERATNIGIYFDGCEDGRDCPCCRDRWHEPWDTDGDDEPILYGKPAANYSCSMAWMDEGKEICVHYADGRKEWHGVNIVKLSELMS